MMIRRTSNGLARKRKNLMMVSIKEETRTSRESRKEMTRTRKETMRKKSHVRMARTNIKQNMRRKKRNDEGEYKPNL